MTSCRSGLASVPSAPRRGFSAGILAGAAALAGLGLAPGVASRRRNPALDAPEVRNRMVQQGADPAYLDSDGFSRFLKGELERWDKVVRASGAKLD